MIFSMVVRRADEKKNPMTLEDYNVLMAMLGRDSVEVLPSYFYDENITADLDAVHSILNLHGFEITIKNFKNNLAVGLKEKLIAPRGLEYESFDDIKKMRDITHIHIPNFGLMMIDEVMVLEDACTDNLQSYLNEGWRMLAICPPNGTRRPDYILGRTKEKE